MICWWSTWQQIAQQAVRYLSRPVRYEPMKSNIQILDVDSDWCGAWKAGPRSPESPPLPHFFGSTWSRHRRPEATAEQGKLMATHMKFFLRCGGRSHRFSVINTFAEMNELHHNYVNGAQFKLKYWGGGGGVVYKQRYIRRRTRARLAGFVFPVSQECLSLVAKRSSNLNFCKSDRVHQSSTWKAKRKSESNARSFKP